MHVCEIKRKHRIRAIERELARERKKMDCLEFTESSSISASIVMLCGGSE